MNHTRYWCRRCNRQLAHGPHNLRDTVTAVGAKPARGQREGRIDVLHDQCGGPVALKTG